jgi:hypothetical protein
MTDTTDAPRTLTSSDRCDRCGAAAVIHVTLPSGGELFFCGHHGRSHQDRLEQLSAVISDTRRSSVSV